MAARHQRDTSGRLPWWASVAIAITIVVVVASCLSAVVWLATGDPSVEPAIR